LNLENGSTRTYRIIAEMAKSGFLLSPLIGNATEFGMLYAKRDYLSDYRVKSFSISPVSGRMLWTDNYRVSFKQFGVSPDIDVSRLLKFDEFVDDRALDQISVAEKCYGSIDLVNGMQPAHAKVRAVNMLRVHGWLAKSVDNGTVPDSALLVLNDSNGRRAFIKTRQTLRPDVGAAFNKPALNTSGYSSTSDISTFEGDSTLHLAFKDGDKIKLCPQLKIPVAIRKEN
jgi:hypothetical protein